MVYQEYLLNNGKVQPSACKEAVLLMETSEDGEVRSAARVCYGRV